MKNGKPYILFGCLNSPSTTGSHLFRNFVKVLGRDNVVSCGPEKSGLSWDLSQPAKSERFYALDVELPYKNHPEIYTYTEIFDLVKSFGYSTDFDFIVFAEPNLYPCVGDDGFKPSCPVCYHTIDTHRSPRNSMMAVAMGQLDYISIANSYHYDIFNTQHLIEQWDRKLIYNPPKKIIWSPTAADPDVHKRYPEEPDYEKYDIIFLGADGIEKSRGGAHENFQMAYKWMNCRWKNDRGDVLKEEEFPYFQNSCPQDHRFGEYNHRAEMLCLMRRHFAGKFAILPGSIHPIEYAKILNKGKIIVNSTINQDLNMRVTEAMSCGRVLYTDDLVWGIDEVCGKNYDTHVRYRKFYHPLNINFMLEWDIIRKQLTQLLENGEEIRRIQENAYNWIRETKQTYEERCRNLLKECIGWTE